MQFIHWEKGRDVFERLLLDSDWAINNGNWLWLSSSAFFNQVRLMLFPNTVINLFLLPSAIDGFCFGNFIHLCLAYC